jgi:hypothetical protein
MDAYEELPGHHLCSALDLVASTPVPSTRTLRRPWVCSTVRSLPAAMTLEIDDLTCIRRLTIWAPRTRTLPITATIRLTNASTSMGLSRQIWKPRRLLEGGTSRHLTLSSLAHGTKPNSSVQPKEHNLSRFKNCKLSSMRNERTCAYFSKPSSRSVRRAHVAEELEREPAMSIIASSSQPERRRRRHASPQYA